MKILITGKSKYIGYHLTLKLVDLNWLFLIDNLSRVNKLISF